MSEKLGPITYGKSRELIFLGREISSERDYSEKVAAEIDKEVKAFIDKAYEAAKKIVVSRGKALKAIAEKLIEKETLEQEEFANLIKSFQIKTGNDKLISDRTCVRSSVVPARTTEVIRSGGERL